MNRIQEELTSERVLKKFLRESDFAFLEKLNSRILTALDEKRAAHILEENERIKRDEKRTELLALIESEGFTLADFAPEVGVKKIARRRQKYQYTENGVTKYWSGVGRMPVVIQQAVDSGKSLDGFLIKKVTSDE